MSPFGGAAPVTVQPDRRCARRRCGRLLRGIGGRRGPICPSGFEACIDPPHFPLAHRRPIRRPVLDAHSCDAGITAQKKILAFPPIAHMDAVRKYHQLASDCLSARHRSARRPGCHERPSYLDAWLSCAGSGELAPEVGIFNHNCFGPWLVSPTRSMTRTWPMEPPYRRPTPGTPLCLLGPIACFSDRGRLARAGRHATTARAKACRDRADDGDPLQLIGPACPPKTLVSGRVLSVAMRCALAASSV